MIKNIKVDYPVHIMDDETYDYYVECEKKSKLIDTEIKAEATKMAEGMLSRLENDVTIQPYNKILKQVSFGWDLFTSKWYCKDKSYDYIWNDNWVYSKDKELNEYVLNMVNEYAKPLRDEFKKQFDDFKHLIEVKEKRRKILLKILGVSTAILAISTGVLLCFM